MTKNMLEILKNIDSNKGQVINSLIKSNILTVGDVVNAAIESEASSVIWAVAIYTNGLNNEDIEKLVDAIIAKNNAKYIYCFACKVKGAPIEKLAKAIFATGDMEYINLFMQNVSGISEEYKNMMYAVLEGNKRRKERNEAMAKLIELTASGDLKTIDSQASVYYRSLLIDEEYIKQKNQRQM